MTDGAKIEKLDILSKIEKLYQALYTCCGSNKKK